MRKLIALVVLVTLMTLSGCGAQPASSTTSGTSATYPLTITDALGTPVALGNKPHKIISLALASDEILAALCDKSDLFGLSSLADDKFYSNITDFAASIPHKYSGKDLEKIIQAQPDLVVTASWADARDISRLRAAGIAVYTFKISDNLDDIRSLITTMGKLSGENAKASALLANMNSKLATIGTACAEQAHKRQLRGLLTDNLFYVFGKNTLSAQLLDVCHIQNIADKIGVSGVQNVSKERIVAAQPDMIFIAAYSAEEKGNPANVYLKDSAFSTVPAVRNKAVFCIANAHLTTTSQYIVLGAADMAHAAYPEIVF